MQKGLRRKTTEAFYHQFKLSTLILLMSALFIGLGMYLYISSVSHHKEDVKEKKLEMTKLPKEVKKKLTGKKIAASFRVPILIYHYVEIVTDKRDKTRQSLTINPYIFKNQIVTLKNAGYTFITPKELAESLDGKRKLPQKPVIISFDDGYRDFYTDVFPILKKEQVKAIAYIVPGFLDHINYMYQWQLRDVISSGLVEIGAHTLHHVYLKGASKATADHEITQSKKMLEANYTIPIVSFAYPYGAFDLQSIDMVKHAGFTNAVSTVGGNEVNQENRYFLYRIHPGANTGKALVSVIERIYPKQF